MTKDEMIKEFMIDNYDYIQERIKELMKIGMHHLYVVREEFIDLYYPEMACFDSTIERLIKDGFDIKPYEEDQWIISW